MHRAIISVGSNIEPELNLEKARSILSSEIDFVDQAEIIKTAPEGYTEQADFLNGAYLVKTKQSLDEFKRYLKGIESRMHRVRGPIKAGPRNIDLDLIAWDECLVHADYPEKSYVKGPVDELLERHSLVLRSL